MGGYTSGYTSNSRRRGNTSPRGNGDDQTEQGLDIFVAYPGPDRPRAQELVARLQDRCRVFWDGMLKPGDRWAPVLDQALRDAKVVAVLISHKTEQAHYQHDEIATIVAMQREAPERHRVVPVLLDADASMTYGLRGYVDLRADRDGWPDGVAERLLEAVSIGEQAPERGRGRPKPTVAPPQTQKLIDELKRLTRKLKLLKLSGATTGDLAEVEARRVRIKRQMREAGQPCAGDWLADRYELVEFLGRGGYATVWKAWDDDEEEVVAVKVLHAQFAGDATRKDRFFRGARVMAGLKHPGVVDVREARAEDDGHPFFVMDYLPGGDFRRAVLDQKLSPQQVLASVVKVGEAVAFAHEKGNVHRDIKPANLLMDAEGVVKLTDFDLVKAVDTTGGTRTGAMGTFLYAAPETQFSAKEADPRCDIYSLAMTALFGLYGKDLPLVVLKQTEQFVDDLACPDGVKQVLLKALDWDPAHRPKTAGEFCEALQQATEPTPSQPPVPAETSSTEWPLHVVAGDDKQAALGQIRRWLNSGKNPDAVANALHLSSQQTDDQETLQLIGAALLAVDKTGERLNAVRERAGGAVALGIPVTPWASIPAGRFLMGSPANEDGRWDDEGPLHRVRITSPFLMLATPVTQALYQVVTGNTPSHFVGDLRRPVEQVSHREATQFCQALSKILGPTVRLPTEAEWEYACRAETNTRYWKGDDEADLDTVGWYGENSGRTIHPVGEKPANPWGLFDVHGNVFEWCHSPWASYGSRAEDVDPAKTPPAGKPRAHRLFRGGSWSDVARNARSACRFHGVPGDRLYDLGFRLVRLPPAD